MNPYRVHARDYAARARARLDEGTFDSLIYAALEIRCGIEARLQSYLDAQRQADARLKQGWKVANLHRALERHFRTGDKIVRILISDRGAAPSYVLLYTPVTGKLRRLAGMIDPLRHALPHRGEDDPWWNEQRTLLEGAQRDLELAARGNLLGVPLLNKKTGIMHTTTELLPDQDYAEFEAVLFVGAKKTLEVDYFDALPEPIAVDSPALNAMQSFPRRQSS